MDITKYTSYFHDGEVLNVEHNDGNIKISMRSAEIDLDSIDPVLLTKDNRLVGILHVNGVKLIINNEKKFEQKMKMLLSDNDLLHLEIKEGVVFCEIGWRGGNPCQFDFSAFEIHADEIWWENMPDYKV
ncbi:MAG: hypothetical protein Q8L98_00010 [Chlamydiales bacterium]|nr:hypothetical protein [Chlamydiales bacterium]